MVLPQMRHHARTLLLLAIFGHAHGDPFMSRDQLKAAVDNCLAVDPTGVACCERLDGCGPAGTTEMPGWDVSLVTDLSELFKGATAFNADITGWIVEASDTTNMFYGASAWLSAHMNCGYDASDTTVCSSSFPESDGPYNGPPNAWVRCPDGCVRPHAKNSLSSWGIVGIVVACLFVFDSCLLIVQVSARDCRREHNFVPLFPERLMRVGYYNGVCGIECSDGISFKPKPCLALQKLDMTEVCAEEDFRLLPFKMMGYFSRHHLRVHITELIRLPDHPDRGWGVTLYHILIFPAFIDMIYDVVNLIYWFFHEGIMEAKEEWGKLSSEGACIFITPPMLSIFLVWYTLHSLLGLSWALFTDRVHLRKLPTTNRTFWYYFSSNRNVFMGLGFSGYGRSRIHMKDCPSDLYPDTDQAWLKCKSSFNSCRSDAISNRDPRHSTIVCDPDGRMFCFFDWTTPCTLEDINNFDGPEDQKCGESDRLSLSKISMTRVHLDVHEHLNAGLPPLLKIFTFLDVKEWLAASCPSAGFGIIDENHKLNGKPTAPGDVPGV